MQHRRGRLDGAGGRRVAAVSVLGVAVATSVMAAGPAQATEPAAHLDSVPEPSDAVGPFCASDLDLDALAGQTIVALVSDPAQLDDVTSDAATSDAAPGRLVLDQIAGIAPVGDFVDLLGPITDASWLTTRSDDIGPPPLLASDEEGGIVQRFDSLLGSIPSARRQVEEFSPDEVADVFAEYGRQLSSLGVSMAFAPVVDVGGGPAIGSRSYGDEPDVVIAYAGAVIEGYLRAGITPVLKHFPGHGRASADTHDGAAITPPLDDLRSSDLLPYPALLADDVAVMVGHLDVPDLTDGRPASLSHAAITGLLRDELGFDGLVVSDALGMGAIRQVASPEDAIVEFLLAGGDLALVDWADAEASRLAVVGAVEAGQLEPLRLHQAVDRVLRVSAPASTNCSIAWSLHAVATVRGGLALLTAS